MKKLDFLSELQDIDDDLLEEALGTKQSTISIPRSRIAIIAAAAMMAIMLVACGVYSALAASSEVYISKYTSATVNDRIDSLDPLQYDHDHIAQMAIEYGIAKEDIVVKHYHEYLSHGYYFDEVFIVTKEAAVARVITDAKNFTFDVEFIGFFHNEKKDEFKAVSQKTTAQGGTIEIVMNAEDGWECFGGFLGRSHPEATLNTFSGSSAMDNIDSRAILFMNDYTDKLIQSNATMSKEKIEVATLWDYYNTHIYEDTFAPTQSDNPIARIEQIASKYGMAGISSGETFYDKRILTGEKFIEVGYAYDKNGLIAFVNNNIPTMDLINHSANSTGSTNVLVCVRGVFYNAEKNQYRVVEYEVLTDGKGIWRMVSKDGWECIGISMFRSMPEAEKCELTSINHFTPVKGDEADSQKFFEKVKRETEIDKSTNQSAFEMSTYKNPKQTASSTIEPIESSDIIFSETRTASEISVRLDNEDEENFFWILDYYDKKERLAKIAKEYLDEKFSIAPPVYDPDFDYDEYYENLTWSSLGYDYDKNVEDAPYYYEKGFVQIDNKAVVFNITNNNAIEFKTLVTGIFYNAANDECLAEEHYVEAYGGTVITMTANEGWELKSIIISTYEEGDDKPVTTSNGIEPITNKATNLYNEIWEQRNSNDFIKEFLER